MGKQIIAMLLAGGRGSRLSVLTRSLAKPAVPFGGKYRIIDFPLSNCTNSRINTVGVLTQYEPHELNNYIGIGTAWDLDRANGGVTVLTPYSQDQDMKWFKGTASAIYQHMHYVDKYDPEHVLILSADHIYKMDYGKMLDFHIKNEADATISVIEVPFDEASRFGIMNTDSNCRVMEFEEKPENPKSNLASMGIYIFKTSVLKEFLKKDNDKKQTTHDFGKDVIPDLIETDMRIYAYPFKGYWKDVGTVESLWEANMDLLDAKNTLDLEDKNWRIYSVNTQQPPQFISTTANISNSLVNEGCEIAGEVDQSVVFQNVCIKNGARLYKCVIMPGCVIEEDVELKGVIVPPNTVVSKNTKYVPTSYGSIYCADEVCAALESEGK